MNITYRRWILYDTQSIRNILCKTWLDTYSSYVPEEDLFSYLDQHYSTELIEKSIGDRDIIGFIVEVDGTAAGCMRTHYNREEGRLYVQQLYILPQYQRLGLGKQLMIVAAERAQSLELDRVWLGVMVKNEPAVLWYKKMGYKIVETTPFTMEKTVVEHHIGYVPIDRIFASVQQRPVVKQQSSVVPLDDALLAQKTHVAFRATSFHGELAQLCLDLLERQKAVWPETAEGYAALGEVKVREITCNGFAAQVQFNPKRIDSTSAEVDAQTIAHRVCFLCLEHLPSPQVGILYRDAFIILCNPAPIFNSHFTVSSVRHISQDFESSLGIMLDLARDLSPAFTVFYNGPKCGASAPDHLHFQVSPRRGIPVELDAIDVKRRKGFYYKDHVAGYTLTNYGRATMVVESTDKQHLLKFSYKIIGEERKILRISEEPMMNVLCSYQEDLWRLIIFLRRKHRPNIFFKTGEDRILVSPAAVDMGGLIITPLEKDFMRLDSTFVESIFKEVSVEQSTIEELLKALL